ncbi:MAG: helix-turn-helix transcriptional regulator [Curvibacter lanceolatus]|uniref:helix-turn-helix domain-containing protein n=1 Tax=Curvibacter lanceolatus TaxID=86182 RepID=UPI000380680D|nr:AraC family transcriptional regulator [Curvibacter lanceolatus]MBV5293547.1 helix-turn-helix transcriptional regulator [Curvibacter lanceolatus]
MPLLHTFDKRRWSQAQQTYLDEPLAAVPDEQIRQSSRGRPWHGLSVWHQVADASDLYIPPAGKHCIIVRNGPPTRLLQQHGTLNSDAEWRTGEVLVLPANTPSYWQSELPRDNLHLDLSPQWLERVHGAPLGPDALRSCFGVQDRLLADITRTLITSLADNSSLQPRFADGMAMSVAVHLLEHYRAPGSQAPRPSGLSRRQLQTVAELVNAHLHRAVTLQEMAEACQLSPYHFSRSFKFSTGLTPHRYVLQCKMERALERLRHSRKPIADIAIELGFATASHFSKRFLNHWGQTPSALRRAH